MPSKDVAPELSVYRLDENKQKLFHRSKMDLIEKDKNRYVYESLTNTPLKLKLIVYFFNGHVLIKVSDKKNKTLLFESSLEKLQNPIQKIQGYLEIFHGIDCIQTQELGLEERIVSLVETISKTETDRQKFIQCISEEPHALHHLQQFRLKLLRQNLSDSSKQLIEETIFSGFGMNCPNWEQLDASTFFQLLESKDNRQSIHVLRLFPNNIPSDLEQLYRHLESVQELYPEAKIHIELVLNEVLESLRTLPHPSHKIHLKTITFCQEKDSKVFYQTFVYKFRQGFVHRPPPHELHPYLYDYFQLFRYENFDLVHDFLHSRGGNYLFYATAKKASHAKVDEIRLIGFRISQDILSLAEDFKNVVDSMEASLCSDSQPKAFFNRIVLHSMHPLTTTEEEVDTRLKELVIAYRERLKKLRIEKVTLKFYYNHHHQLIEYKNILDLTIRKTVATLNTNAPIKPVMTASAIELRELQFILKNKLWAYRLPDLIQTISKRIRAQSPHSPIDESFVELDIDHTTTVIHPSTGSLDFNYGELIPVSRPYGHNAAGVVIGLITSDLGVGIPIKRVLIIGDLSHPSKGAVRAQECVRINAAIRYAAQEKLPIDWYTAAFGVQVDKERGVEGLDAAASTLREIVDNSHHKNVPINLIVNEINIGAQSYWDAMATILHDTNGILIMTPDGSMALTGPKALACALYSTVGSEQIEQYSKSLFPKGIQSLSGHETIHGPNSDSMLFARDIEEALYYLLLHHYYSYIRPGETIASPRSLKKENPPSTKSDLAAQEVTNFLKNFKPNRQAILDYLRDDGSMPPLRFWEDAKGKKSADQNGFSQEPSTIVQEMLIGGHPTMVIFTPTGALTPVDSDIISRAIYKASGRTQVLIIGSLSGFNSDPLSMENRQLLEGALIAKSIVEYRGPIMIFNLSNFVGGTFAVFNKQLNRHMKILAIEGSHVQVIGGKSAAKVVFHSQVLKQADRDPRVADLLKQRAAIDSPHVHSTIQKISNEKMNEIDLTYRSIRSQVVAEIENKAGLVFDNFHNAQRAMKVRSIDKIVPFEQMREAIISTFEEQRAGYLKALDSWT